MKIRLVKKLCKRNNNFYGVYILKSIKQWHKVYKNNTSSNFIKWCIKFENNIIK